MYQNNQGGGGYNQEGGYRERYSSRDSYNHQYMDNDCNSEYNYQFENQNHNGYQQMVTISPNGQTYSNISGGGDVLMSPPFSPRLNQSDGQDGFNQGLDYGYYQEHQQCSECCQEDIGCEQFDRRLTLHDQRSLPTSPHSQDVRQDIRQNQDVLQTQSSSYNNYANDGVMYDYGGAYPSQSSENYNQNQYQQQPRSFNRRNSYPPKEDYDVRGRTEDYDGRFVRGRTESFSGEAHRGGYLASRANRYDGRRDGGNYQQNRRREDFYGERRYQQQKRKEYGDERGRSQYGQRPRGGGGHQRESGGGYGRERNGPASPVNVETGYGGRQGGYRTVYDSYGEVKGALEFCKGGKGQNQYNGDGDGQGQGANQFKKEKAPQGWVPTEGSIADLFKFDQQNVSQLGSVNETKCVVSGDDSPRLFDSWENSGLHPHLLEVVTKKCCFEKPRTIQASAIAEVLAGKNILAQAVTGSGKTFAFVLPIVDKIMRMSGAERGSNKHAPMVIVVQPTRELAVQVYDAFRRVTEGTNIRCVRAIGQMDRWEILDSLSHGVDIYVGTCGRLMELCERGDLNLHRLRFFVLDEADRLLNHKDIEHLQFVIESAEFKKTEKVRQTLVFSATMPKECVDMAERLMKNGFVSIKNNDTAANKLVKQIYVETKGKMHKNEQLRKLFDADKKEGKVVKTLIFVDTKKQSDFLAFQLVDMNYAAHSINGDRPQNTRDEIYRKFMDGRISILVGTDVCSRGWDIPSLQRVINYDLPKRMMDGTESAIDKFIHRIGRTGRVKEGTAISFVDHMEDRDISKDLVKTCREVGQTPPNFLLKMAGYPVPKPSPVKTATKEKTPFKSATKEKPVESVKEKVEPEPKHEASPDLVGEDCVDSAKPIAKVAEVVVGVEAETSKSVVDSVSTSSEPVIATDSTVETTPVSSLPSSEATSSEHDLNSVVAEESAQVESDPVGEDCVDCAKPIPKVAEVVVVVEASISIESVDSQPIESGSLKVANEAESAESFITANNVKTGSSPSSSEEEFQSFESNTERSTSTASEADLNSHVASAEDSAQVETDPVGEDCVDCAKPIEKTSVVVADTEDATPIGVEAETVDSAPTSSEPVIATDSTVNTDPVSSLPSSEETSSEHDLNSVVAEESAQPESDPVGEDCVDCARPITITPLVSATEHVAEEAEEPPKTSEPANSASEESEIVKDAVRESKTSEPVEATDSSTGMTTASKSPAPLEDPFQRPAGFPESFADVSLHSNDDGWSYENFNNETPLFTHTPEESDGSDVETSYDEFECSRRRLDTVAEVSEYEGDGEEVENSDEDEEFEEAMLVPSVAIREEEEVRVSVEVDVARVPDMDEENEEDEEEPLGSVV